MKYDSFGNVTSGLTSISRYLYTGQEYDADTGLYYYNARWYDPKTGRFLSQDPLGFAAGDLNLSRYVNNGVVNASDPSGLAEVDEFGVPLGPMYPGGIDRWIGLPTGETGFTLPDVPMPRIPGSGWPMPFPDPPASPPFYSGSLDPTFRLPEGFDPLDPWDTTKEIDRIRIIGSLWDDYDEWRRLFDDELDATNSPIEDDIKLFLDTGADVLHTALPRSAPDTIICYKDGTKRIILGGGPRGDDLAKQAALILSLLKLRNCFPAGTQVSTESGLKPIESIEREDKVWALDHVSGLWKLCRVLETYRRAFEGALVSVHVQGEQIESTEHHPYWVASGDGLASRPRPEHVPDDPVDSKQPGRWVDAADLQIGDVLLLRNDTTAAIERITTRQSKEFVYNFHVEELQCYAVGPFGVLVHNNSGEAKRVPASEKRARSIADRIERELGRDARRRFHDEKLPGMGDRTLEELLEDAREIFRELGKEMPPWLEPK